MTCSDQLAFQPLLRSLPWHFRRILINFSRFWANSFPMFWQVFLRVIVKSASNCQTRGRNPPLFRSDPGAIYSPVSDLMIVHMRSLSLIMQNAYFCFEDFVQRMSGGSEASR
jgi:hypothetical protein